MSEMVPLPPEQEEAGRPGWVVPLAIVSAVLVVALIGYLVWDWVGGLPEGSTSLLSFLSRSPSSDATIALTLVTIGTAAPTVRVVLPTATLAEGAALPTATPALALKSPTTNPATAITNTPLSPETPSVPKPTDQPAVGEDTDEMPPTGIGAAYLIPVAMGLALLLVLARILRVRYQG